MDVYKKNNKKIFLCVRIGSKLNYIKTQIYYNINRSFKISRGFISLLLFLQGHKMAEVLAKSGIQTILVPDVNIFAFMPRVTKVIVGTNLVLRSGGLRASPGTQMLSLVAHDHKVPVIVVAPTYKFSRMLSEGHLADNETFNLLANPQGVADFRDGDLAEKVRVLNPMFDFVPPDHVSQVVSNLGTYGVSQMFTAISELYGTGDESAEDLKVAVM